MPDETKSDPIRVQAVKKGFYGRGPLGRRIMPGTVFYIESESEFSDFHRKQYDINGRPKKPGWMIKVEDDVHSTRPDNGPQRPGLPVITTPPGGTTMEDPLKPVKDMIPPPPPPAAPETVVSDPPAVSLAPAPAAPLKSEEPPASPAPAEPPVAAAPAEKPETLASEPPAPAPPKASKAGKKKPVAPKEPKKRGRPKKKE